MQALLKFCTFSAIILWISLMSKTPAIHAEEKSDREKLAGAWKVTSMSFGNEDIPANVADKFIYTFSGTKLNVRGRLVSNGNQFIPVAANDQYTFTLGKSGEQKTIDLKPAAVDNARFKAFTNCKVRP